MSSARSSVDRLVRKYVVAVSLLVLLTVFRHWVDEYGIALRKEDAQMINISGRQRMLSQKLTKTALMMMDQTSSDAHAALQDTLRYDLDRWMRAHHALQYGDSVLAMSSRPLSDEMKRLFIRIEPSYQQVRKSIGMLVESDFKESQTTAPAAMNTLLAHEKIFLSGMESITNLFTTESNNRLKVAANVELGLMAFTLLLIVIDAVYIFRPSVKQIRSAFNETTDVQHQLRDANDEMSALNEELTSSNEELRAINDQLELANETILAQSDIIVRQKEERLNRVLDNSTDVIWSIDLTGAKESYISRSAEKIYQLSVEELVNVPGFWYNQVVEEDTAIVRNALDKLNKEGSAECQFRIRNSSNEIRWMYCRPRIVRNHNGKEWREEGILQDVTAQQQAEEVMREYRQNLDIIFQSTEEGILLMDNKGKVVLFNRWFQNFISEVSGIQPVSGMPFLEVVAPHRRVYAAGLFAKALRGETVVTEGEFQGTGGKITHAVHYQPIISDGEVTHVCITSRDITERKKTENEKSSLVRQLTEQNNDLIQFSFIASHNLRGPVASMIGLLNLIKSPDTSPQLLATMHTMLETSVFRLDSVIKDLAMILSIRNNVMHAREYILVREIVDIVQTTLRTQLDEAGAQIKVDDSAIGDFYTIRTYFHSILYNLISNAIKFRSPDRKLVINVSTFKTSGSHGIVVSDNGVGVDLEKYREKMFMLYQRMHMEIEGKGIGLYMVKTQIQMLNGTISVDSTPGEGTAFTIQFPTKES